MVVYSLAPALIWVFHAGCSAVCKFLQISDWAREKYIMCRVHSSQLCLIMSLTPSKRLYQKHENYLHSQMDSVVLLLRSSSSHTCPSTCIASSWAIMTPNSMRKPSSVSVQGQSHLTQWHYSKSPSLWAGRVRGNAKRLGTIGVHKELNAPLTHSVTFAIKIQKWFMA